MKRRSLSAVKLSAVLLGAVLTVGLVSCGQKEGVPAQNTPDKKEEAAQEDETEVNEENEEPEEAEEEQPEEPEEPAVITGEAIELPEGMYISELTGEPIDEALKDQRPIAAMVDNDERALPHYEIAEGDIVYEMMNSTHNDRVTRFMVIRKDWGSIEQMGSIRSVRPTNIPLAAEYNAVICHDGGPYYIDEWFAKPYAAHFSATFGRVENGKAREFTEYILPGDLDKNFADSGYTKEYNEYRPSEDPHFVFTEYGTETVLKDRFITYQKAENIDLSACFLHNGSGLTYNEETGLYEYHEYGEVHKDAEDDEVLAFKNVLLLDMEFVELDENGYLIYNMIDTSLRNAKYITNGGMINVSWMKESETAVTRFFDETGTELKVNPGKTYIALIPSDSYAEMVIE